ncbi:uncharacterized protein LOC124805398 [Schistocerca piceifrons]|uniref:uncharacterized protein LOC124805398 n=1 Tax=Schistocerca piceifrons TaxID=274613 RepID=UPI001F5FC760|nr:uncharacterized protein LOC124805398 [Schistocerca piceifrons]
MLGGEGPTENASAATAARRYVTSHAGASRHHCRSRRGPRSTLSQPPPTPPPPPALCDVSRLPIRFGSGSVLRPGDHAQLVTATEPAAASAPHMQSTTGRHTDTGGFAKCVKNSHYMKRDSQ